MMRIPFDDLESSFRFVPLESVSKFFKVAATHWKSWRDIRWFRRASDQEWLRRFRPKVRLYIDAAPYVIKTVESSWELESALRLRTRVFYEELLGRAEPGKLDWDEFDSLSDHLVIQDSRTGQCVGTYRLISSSYSGRFYSSTEFDLKNLLALPGIKLELGRACIDKDYRTGRVIALLWSGITQYFQRVDARYLFGCASVHTLDPVDVSRIRAYLRARGHVNERLDLAPHHPMSWAPIDLSDVDRARRLIPPLLQSYLRMGAKVAAEPAVDEAFHCVDFLTLLDRQALSATYERKFVGASARPADTVGASG